MCRKQVNTFAERRIIMIAYHKSFAPMLFLVKAIFGGKCPPFGKVFITLRIKSEGMRTVIRKILIFSMMAITAMPCAIAARSWESVKTSDRVQQSRVVKQTSEIEVRASRGTIIVTASRPVQVRVFSILGQMVSQETLPAGTSMLQLDMHGVFIVKIADLTCKVAL